MTTKKVTLEFTLELDGDEDLFDVDAFAEHVLATADALEVYDTAGEHVEAPYFADPALVAFVRSVTVV